MEDTISSREELPYRVTRNDDDMIRNLHMLYDAVCIEPVPDYLMDLLKRLPE